METIKEYWNKTVVGTVTVGAVITAVLIGLVVVPFAKKMLNTQNK